LLDLVLIEMAQSVYTKIIVNILEHDGMITPAMIQKQKIPRAGGGRVTHGAKDVLTLELLDDRRYLQTIYFDDDGKIFHVRLDQEKTYFLYRSSAEEVRDIFPERANFILGTEKAN
jgi:hypothetical protein